MSFTKKSEKLIDLFINDIDLFFKERTKKNQKIYNNILNILYQDILITNKYVNFLSKKNKIKFEVKEIVNLNQISNQDLLNGSLVDKKCYNFIKNNIKGVMKLHTTIQKLNVTINYAFFKKNEFNNLKKIEKLLLRALKIVRFCNLYRKNEKVKSLNINLYLTPEKKKLPNDDIDILGPEHCNSAVTFACSTRGELLIYRHEEWKKTLIHELFHSLCLDFSLMNYEKLKKNVNSIFKVNSEFLISETYAEFWANIINCCFCSYSFLKDKSDIDGFILYSEFCIHIEKIFSLFQCVKILDFMNLKYKHLWLDDKISDSYRNILFKEKTNVFSYYILKTIFLTFDDEFFVWCYNNNSNILNFDSSEILFNKLFKFIKKKYKSNKFLADIELMENKITECSDLNNKLVCHTMRMTICDYMI